MTAAGKCEVCGEITGFYRYRGGGYDGPEGWFCADHNPTKPSIAQPKKIAYKCAYCENDASLFFRYMGWAVAWLCSDHHPKQESTVADLLKRFKGNPPVLPRHLLMDGHPFKSVCERLVASEEAIWADEITTAYMIPAAEIYRPNRGSRREALRARAKAKKKNR